MKKYAEGLAEEQKEKDKVAADELDRLRKELKEKEEKPGNGWSIVGAITGGVGGALTSVIPIAGPLMAPAAIAAGVWIGDKVGGEIDKAVS